MIGIYVCDSERGSARRRPWQNLVGAHVDLYWDGSQPSGGTPTQGDIIVCHGPREELKSWLETLSQNGVFVINVRQNDVPRVAPVGNCYTRAKGVGNPIDIQFAACFSYFVTCLEESGIIDWELLEGPPPPDALLAYHLLDILADPMAVDAREALAGVANAEAHAIASASNGIQPLRNLNDPAERRQFLRMCC